MMIVQKRRAAQNYYLHLESSTKKRAKYDSLKVLYTEAFKFPYLEVKVGGRVVQLDCFHYVDSSNSGQPEYNNKRAKKFELIARGEQVFIYRWEIKACLLAYLRTVTEY